MLVALLLTAGLCARASSAQQKDDDGRSDPARPQIEISLGAVDREGRPVEGLKPEDLRITVEGQPQLPTFFRPQADGPLHVVIMLDASASQERVLPFAQEAADRLVPALLLRGSSNDAAVVSFTGDPKVVQSLTADAAAVRRAVASVEFVPPKGYIPGGIIVGTPPNDSSMRAGSTAVWDALVGVCDKVFNGAAPGRRAVVLVTDGVDTSSRIKPDKAVERLLREGVAVYAVGIGDDRDFDQLDKLTLRKLSERTGGRALFPKRFGDVPAAFEQVRRELFSSYVLAFAAPPMQTGKPHKLRVELVNPELRRRGVQLAYPQSLFAATAPGRR